MRCKGWVLKCLCPFVARRHASAHLVAPPPRAFSNLVVPRPRAPSCHIAPPPGRRHFLKAGQRASVASFLLRAGIFFGWLLSHLRSACVFSVDRVSASGQRAFSRVVLFLFGASVHFLGDALFSFTPSVRFLGCSCFRCVSACVFSGGVVPSSGWREFSRGGAVFVYAQLAFFRLVVVMFRFCVPFIGRCCFRLRSACAFMVDRVFCFGPACVLSGGADPSSGRRAYSWGVAVFTHARRAFSLLITLLSRIGVFFSGGVAPSSGQRAFLRLALFSFTPSVRFHG